MNPWELIRFALGAIAAHPMRSALTTRGVVIGVAAVVMMTSIGLGAQKRVEELLGFDRDGRARTTPFETRGDRDG